MSEPNFSRLSLPDFIVAEIDDRIDGLREKLRHRDAVAMIEPLRRLEKVRGHVAFDLISSLAWAAEAVCRTAASDRRSLNELELSSLGNAIVKMDRAMRAATLLAAAV